jgi:SAM-dependent methyltransferase
MSRVDLRRRRDLYDDAALYDWEYRRRRDDVGFYRMLADERGGPILDLGCGTGRLLVPLLRSGHTVVGVDRAPAMLARAAARLRRLAPAVRRRALLVRGDLRALGFGPRFAFAIAAFHGVQELATAAELVRFLRGAAGALIPGGWLAFDTFAPDADFQARDPNARWARTRFRHPATGERLVYSESHRRRGAILSMTFHYQPVDARGRQRGPERRVRLEHRLLAPSEAERLLARAGLELIAAWGGWSGEPITDDTEQHVFLARRRDRSTRLRSTKRFGENPAKPGRKLRKNKGNAHARGGDPS